MKKENGFGEHLKKMMPVLGLEKTYSREEVKAFVIDMLEKMMPKKKELDDFKGTEIVDAIEWGMTKEKQQERLVYLRAISKIDERLDDFVLAVTAKNEK